jgi:hypothetical protein
MPLRLPPEQLSDVAWAAKTDRTYKTAFDALEALTKARNEAIADAQLLHACLAFREFLEDWHLLSKDAFVRKYGRPVMCPASRLDEVNYFDAWLKREGIVITQEEPK